MSNWSSAEVNALKHKNNGGNDAARRTWLANWSPSKMRKPCSDDKLDYYKEFVKRVYIDKAFYGDGSDNESSRGYTTDPLSSDQDDWSDYTPKRIKKKSAPKKKTTPVMQDLLDFDDTSPPIHSESTFDPFGTAELTTAVNSVEQTGSWDPFGTSSPASQATTSTSSNSDMFGDFSPAIAAVQTSDPFAFVETTTKKVEVDPFAFVHVPKQPQKVSVDPFAFVQVPKTTHNPMSHQSTCQPMKTTFINNSTNDRIGNMMAPTMLNGAMNSVPSRQQNTGAKQQRPIGYDPFAGL